MVTGYVLSVTTIASFMTTLLRDNMEDNEPQLYDYEVRAKASYEIFVTVQATDPEDAKLVAMDALLDYGEELPSTHDNVYDILEVKKVPDEV